MRFWLGGPRIFGLRTGVSFGAEDFRRLKASGRAPASAAGSGVQKVGFVYIIRGEHNLIKVGCSANPRARIAQLRTASPYPLAFDYIGMVDMPLMVGIEQETHALLDKHRLNGEWFDCPAQMAVAALHGAAHGLGGAVIPAREDQIDQAIAVSQRVDDSGAPIKRGPSPNMRVTYWILGVLLPLLFLLAVSVLQLDAAGKIAVAVGMAVAALMFIGVAKAID